MRDRFDIFGTVTRIRKLFTFGNDVKNTQQAFLAPLPGKVGYQSEMDIDLESSFASLI